MKKRKHIHTRHTNFLYFFLIFCLEGKNIKCCTKMKRKKLKDYSETENKIETEKEMVAKIKYLRLGFG